MTRPFNGNDSGLKPLEFCVIVELDAPKEKTAGGLYLPNQTQDADKLAAVEATLVAVSPQAFTYADGWPEGSLPEPGARVLFKRHTGWLYEKEIAGEKRIFRILNDKDIVAVVEPVFPAESRLKPQAMARAGEEY